MPETKAVATTQQTPIYLSKMAPQGVDGRVWARVLKEQLLASKEGEPTDEELLYFAQVCQATQLDPTKREIYGIYRKNKQKDGTYKSVLSIQTGIDGFRVAAERSGKFGGSKEPEFVYDPDVKISVQASGTAKIVPNTAKVTVMKVMGDRVLDTTRTANWSDFYPGDTEGFMWRKLPETMLAKVAEAQALRAAFPNCAQLYLDEELAKPDDIPEPGAVDLNKLAEQIKQAKTTDELFDLINGLSVDDQKKVTTLATERARQIGEEELKNATSTK